MLTSRMLTECKQGTPQVNMSSTLPPVIIPRNPIARRPSKARRCSAKASTAKSFLRRAGHAQTSHDSQVHRRAVGGNSWLHVEGGAEDMFLTRHCLVLCHRND